MRISEELQLIEDIQVDLERFGEIYELYFERIFFYVVSKVGSVEAAEDIVAEVFLAALDGVQKFNTGRGVRFGSWLYRVAHNKVVDYYKKHQVASWLDVESSVAADGSADPALQLEKWKVWEVMGKLPQKQREVLELKIYLDMENPEIAEMLGLSLTNVSTILQRAKQEFKKKYERAYGKGI